MAAVTVIGRGTTVRGRVSGAVDLEVHGFIEGEISVSGETTIEQGGLCGANVTARRIVVRGAVRGDLVAEDSISIESGARVVGEVRAPRVSIAEGGLVRGYVQSGSAGEAPAARTASAPRALPKPAPAAAPRVSAPREAPKVEARPQPTPRPVVAPARPAPMPAAAPVQAKGPPPPVVPALKKAKGAVARKKER